jgi:single-stranded-DNA-specific exonuclease
VAFGCDGRAPAEPGQPVDASFRLERNVWNGTVAPRLVLRSAWPCTPRPIEVLGEREDYLDAVLDELKAGAGLADREPSARTMAIRVTYPDTIRHSSRGGGALRRTLDRRGQSPLAVLADALAAGGPVLAVCADVDRRLAGLAERTGGFSLTSYHSLERQPATLGRFPQLVALDPPARPAHMALLQQGRGYTHLAWGDPELRFAQQMHELEYRLRASLVALYRALRARQRVAGEELEHLLRGEGPHGRPARLAGRLIKVLAELELVSLDPELPALAIAGVTPTALDRSPSYRVYSRRYEDGRRFLSNNANPRSSG